MALVAPYSTVQKPSTYRGIREKTSPRQVVYIHMLPESELGIIQREFVFTHQEKVLQSIND